MNFENLKVPLFSFQSILNLQMGFCPFLIIIIDFYEPPAYTVEAIYSR